MSPLVETRRGTPDDLPAILGLARRALQWTDTDERFLMWKHYENAFGVSPMWVAVDGPRVVGFRTFLRWELVRPDGSVVRAVRAVDTATDPDYQGQGIFTRLTLGALDELRAEGIDLVFNTPNSQSLPGYLKMGWHELGRLPVAVMPASLRFPFVVATARRGAGREGIPTEVGTSIGELLEDEAAVRRVLAALPPPGGLATRRTVELFRWRYGLDELCYRALTAAGTAETGAVIFRLRRRGGATEAVVCDLLVPGDDPTASRSLLRRLARAVPADYVIRIDSRRVTREPFVQVPRVGPVLTCRPLDPATPPPPLAGWSLTMGDVELF